MIESLHRHGQAPFRKAREGQAERLVERMSDGAIWPARALAAAGFAPVTVSRAVAAGLVEKLGRGLYRSVAVVPRADEAIAEAMVRVPQGVLCLASAAALHGLSDRVPHVYQVAIRYDRHPPKGGWPPIEGVPWRPGPAFEVGIETRSGLGVTFRVTGPARTIVDLLGRPGILDGDATLRALREILRRGTSFDVLLDIAHAVASPREVVRTLETLRSWERSE